MLGTWHKPQLILKYSLCQSMQYFSSSQFCRLGKRLRNINSLNQSCPIIRKQNFKYDAHSTSLSLQDKIRRVSQSLFLFLQLILSLAIIWNWLSIFFSMQRVLNVCICWVKKKFFLFRKTFQQGMGFSQNTHIN